jgi:dipeptidyl aminopeptidase/acylaminoacyl peptidase
LKQILLSARNDRDPGAYYLYNKEKGELVFQYQIASIVDRKKLLPMEPIKYQARDGRMIHGYLTKPEGKNLPLLMIVHGGPMARDFWGYNPEAQFFAAKGIAVMQVNFRGSTGYGQDHETSGHLKQGTTMQDDVTDGTLWAIKQGIAAPDKTCIYGASYGGYAAIQGAVREPDLYKCAVGYVGVYDLPLTWKEGDFHNNRKYGKAFLRTVWGEEEKDLIARSPAFHVNRIKIPVMIAHGEDDQRVPFTHAKVLRKKLEEAGKPFIWLTKPGEGHGFTKEANRFEVYTTMINYMNKQLGLGQAKP